MKFLSKVKKFGKRKFLLGRVSSNEITKTKKPSKHLEKTSEDTRDSQDDKIPIWVEMKCNALIYSKQGLKFRNEDSGDENLHFEGDNGLDQTDTEEKILDFPLSSKSLTNNTLSIICPLCHSFIHKCTSTIGGHMFGQFCIDEYLLFRETCPLGEQHIRTKEMSKCQIADSAIEKILSLSHSSLYQQFLKKKHKENLFFEQKKIHAQEVISPKVAKNRIYLDVRDSEYIWGEGIVVAIVETKDKEASLIVHFKGWSNKYDDIIPLSSPRLAKHGFYTKRTDIPRYAKGENKLKKPILNNGKGDYEVIEQLKKQIIDDQFQTDSQSSDSEIIPETIQEHYDYLISKVKQFQSNSLQSRFNENRGDILNSLSSLHQERPSQSNPLIFYSQLRPIDEDILAHSNRIIRNFLSRMTQ